MISIYVHRNGQTEQATSIDRAWLNPASGALLWVDLAAPSIPESLILSDTFAFHPLSVEDAMSKLQYPKIEAYDGYLYAILHGIAFHANQHGFVTHDVDFFIGPNYLVTVHDGHSRSIADLRDHATKNPKILGEGAVALFHRIVDAMVDRYRPEVEKLEDRLDHLENEVFERPTPQLIRAILDEKHDVASLRRVVTPQRDVVARLARRDFVDISTEMAFRFRDV
ncbi:MAG TPA: magnesium transporter CorA family protein, partial [Rhodanobacteraceae bacterium]